MTSLTSTLTVVVVLGSVLGSGSTQELETAGGKSARPTRALPSVSNDHYSELLSDGTYKYAYTGEHRYVAERKLADGTVEGESLYIRPDGVPVKVHYFADGNGYRPKTEVLYKERLATSRLVPTTRIVPIPAPSPPILLAPPRSTGDNSVNANLGEQGASGHIGHEGISINSGSGDYFRNSGSGGRSGINSDGGDVAVANPQVTAIVGPGGRAVIRPEAVARSSGGSRYFRNRGRDSGDVAVANPQTTAIVGPGGSVVVEPKAAAYAGGGEPEVREVHHYTSQVLTPVQRVIEGHVTPHQSLVVHPAPAARAVRVESAPSRGYVYTQPAPPPPALQPLPLQTSSVLLVPPSSRYSYSYGYSAPDPKHPQRDNSAYVNVQVNH